MQLGVEFPTAWARREPARALRDVTLGAFVGPAMRAVTTLRVLGREHLDGQGRLIFTANHVSHLDTTMVLTALPLRIRRKTVVAAAVDTFYQRRRSAIYTTWLFNAIPIERHKVNRRSAEDAQRIVDAGWHLLIFPEGGRTTTGDLGEFKGGAAFLSEKTGATVIPTYIDGVGGVLGHRYAKAEVFRAAPNKLFHHVTVAFGPPLRPLDGENVRGYGTRIHEAVAVLGREVSGDPNYGRRPA